MLTFSVYVMLFGRKYSHRQLGNSDKSIKVDMYLHTQQLLKANIAIRWYSYYEVGAVQNLMISDE